MEKQKNSSDIIRKYGIILILIALFIVSAFISKNFLKPQNLINIMKQISVVTIIACGETILIISGQLDLSAGLMCTTAACFSASVILLFLIPSAFNVPI